MSNTGLTPQGFKVKRLPEIKTGIESRLSSAFGDIDTRPESNFGQLTGIHSELYALLWALAEDVYQSQYPDSASGVSLDDAVYINGLRRTDAAPTKADAVLYGVPSTTIPTGSQASNRRTGAVYQIAQQATISATNAVSVLVEVDTVAAGVYSVNVGALSYSYTATGSDTESSIIQGLFNAMSAAPFARSLDNDGLRIDVSSEVAFSVTGSLEIVEAGTVARFNAVNAGAQVLAANDLTEIETPVSGWDRITNPIAGITGRNRETDEDLRARREQSIQITAQATEDAIFARVRQLELVQDVSVQFNNGVSVDVFGTDPQHVWVIVEGGDDDAIAGVLFGAVAGGIGYRGSEEVTIISDVSGKSHIIKFDRPVYIEPTIQIEIVKLSGFPVGGEDLIKDALVAFGDRLNIGSDLIYSQLYCPANSVAGTQIDLLTVNGSVSNITTDPSEKIRILRDNITIVDVTP